MPAAGLAATLLNVLSGLAIQPRQAAATTTAPLAAVTTSALLPAGTNGVTGVQVGHSRLEMPGALIGDTVAADWYFPTQADGSVDAQGVIWLQHGFGATNIFYSALATQLAQQTNSIVVTPTLSSLPFTLSGGCLTCASSQEAAAAMFEDPSRTALFDSAQAAGYTGDELPTRFVLAGHSAGGGFATAVGADFVNDPAAVDADLLGVVMFDGVSNGALDDTFADQLTDLDGVPVYQIAAPAQSWNLFGATTNVLAATRASSDPGQFIGVVLQGGSHVDSMLGVNPLFDFVLQLVTKRVPAGNTAAVYTLSTGWINDFYAGATPETPTYGLYAASNQQIIMGPTVAFGLPAAQANQLSLGDKIVKGLIDTVGGLFGFQLPPPVNSGDNGLDPNTPVALVGNGVTGVRTGSAVLDIPCGPNGYAAPANWYFPTQADGTVSGQRHHLAAARLPRLQLLVRHHGPAAGPADQQHRGRPQHLLVRHPHLPGLLPQRGAHAGGGRRHVRRQPLRADRQRQLGRLLWPAAAEVHPHRPLGGRELRHRRRRSDRRPGQQQQRGRRPAGRGDVRRRRRPRLVHAVDRLPRPGGHPGLPDRGQAAELERLGQHHRAVLPCCTPTSSPVFRSTTARTPTSSPAPVSSRSWPRSPAPSS